MKTTIDIPDKALQRAKKLAADKGMTLTELVTQAVEDAVRRSAKTAPAGQHSWMRLYGAFAKSEKMRSETRRIQKIIDGEFGRRTRRSGDDSRSR
jgi:hypothetical protein